MLADRSVTVPLDSLIAPLRDVYTDLPFANPYEELVDQPKFSEDYLNARGELLDSIFDGWKRPLLVTYNGSEFLDLRSVLSRTDGFMIVWTPTPKDLLEDALLLAATWHEYDRDDFIQRFGRALVHTIRGWLLLLERMSGFYGRFAIAAQFTESSDGDFVIPLTLDSFRGAVLAALSPDCYADIAIDASPRNVWSRQIENLEAL
jgi:hypothetical protein